MRRFISSALMFFFMLGLFSCSHPVPPETGDISDLENPTYWKINNYLEIFFNSPPDDTPIDDGLITLIDSQTTSGTNLYIAFYDFDREGVILALEPRTGYCTRCARPFCGRCGQQKRCRI